MWKVGLRHRKLTQRRKKWLGKEQEPIEGGGPNTYYTKKREKKVVGGRYKISWRLLEIINGVN